jgi:hypothetical protein
MNLRDEFHLTDLTARMALTADSTNTVLGTPWWVLDSLLFMATYDKASGRPTVGDVCGLNSVEFLTL